MNTNIIDIVFADTCDYIYCTNDFIDHTAVNVQVYKVVSHKAREFVRNINILSLPVNIYLNDDLDIIDVELA